MLLGERLPHRRGLLTLLLQVVQFHVIGGRLISEGTHGGLDRQLVAVRLTVLRQSLVPFAHAAEVAHRLAVPTVQLLHLLLLLSLRPVPVLRHGDVFIELRYIVGHGGLRILQPLRQLLRQLLVGLLRHGLGAQRLLRLLQRLRHAVDDGREGSEGQTHHRGHLKRPDGRGRRGSAHLHAAQLADEHLQHGAHAHRGLAHHLRDGPPFQQLRDGASSGAPTACQRRAKLHHARHGHAQLSKLGDHALVRHEGLADIHHHPAKAIRQLLRLSRVRLRQLGVHVADVLRDDLGEHGRALALVAGLQCLLLGLAKGDAHTPQGARLTLQRLAQ